MHFLENHRTSLVRLPQDSSQLATNVNTTDVSKHATNQMHAALTRGSGIE